MTDEYFAYKSLYEHGYFKHYTVNHSDKIFAIKGLIHTNSVEGLWSNVKRGIYGVYRNVSPKYLQAYVDEYTFRYNNRKNPMMFEILLDQVTSVRSLQGEKLL